MKENIRPTASVPLGPKRSLILSAYRKHNQTIKALAKAAKDAAVTLATLKGIAVPMAVATAMDPGPNVNGSVNG